MGEIPTLVLVVSDGIPHFHQPIREASSSPPGLALSVTGTIATADANRAAALAGAACPPSLGSQPLPGWGRGPSSSAGLRVLEPMAAEGLLPRVTAQAGEGLQVMAPVTPAALFLCCRLGCS